MTLQGLVFDFDGLILDTEMPEFVSLRTAFAAEGAALPVEEWRSRVGATDTRHWTEWLEEILGRGIDRETARNSRLDHHHALIAEQEIRPGVVALLDGAEAASIPVAVASSSPLDWVGGHLERRGLLPRFDVVVTSDDVSRTKPAPDLYLVAVAALGVDPRWTVALEDSAHGCTAAVTAGLYCIVVPNEVTESQDFSHADRVVSSLAELEMDALAADLEGRAAAAS